MKAPLLAAIDEHEDLTGPFAAWLESRGLITVLSRYKKTFPLDFILKTDAIDWTTLEREYLKETHQTDKANAYRAGRVPFKLAIGNLAYECLKWSPVLLIAAWAANR